MAWTDWFTVSIKGDLSASARFDMTVQMDGTPTSTGHEPSATRTGNKMIYESQNNSYDNTQLRSKIELSFIGDDVPSIFELEMAQTPPDKLRLVLGSPGMGQWYGNYIEGTFKVDWKTWDTPTYSMAFSDGLESLANITYSDALSREVTITGPKYYTTTRDVIANIFSLSGYGTSQTIEDYSLLSYRGLTSSPLVQTALFREDLQDGNGNYLDCETILNNILKALNCYIALSHETYNEFIIVSNNYAEHIGVSSWYYTLDFGTGTGSQLTFSTPGGADLTSSSVKISDINFYSAPAYKQNSIELTDGSATRTKIYNINNRYPTTTESRYSNENGVTTNYGLRTGATDTIYDQWKLPASVGAGSLKLWEVSLDWYYGGRSNGERPYYINVSYQRPLASTPIDEPWLPFKFRSTGGGVTDPWNDVWCKPLYAEVDMATGQFQRKGLGYI